MGYIEQVEEEWWKLWYQQCAAGLIFYRRGNNANVEESAQINNLVLLLTVTKMGKGKYTIYCVKKTFPDSDRNDRLVEVEMRPTSNKELPCPTDPGG